MLVAHLKRVLRLGRLRLRGSCDAKDELLLAATAQNCDGSPGCERRCLKWRHEPPAMAGSRPFRRRTRSLKVSENASTEAVDAESQRFSTKSTQSSLDGSVVFNDPARGIASLPFPCHFSPQPYAVDSLVAFPPFAPFLIDPGFEPPPRGSADTGDERALSKRQCRSTITQRAHVAHRARRGDRRLARR
jgi:hypothetical protein